MPTCKMKIALLIPSTSRGRDWKTVKDTYLYNYTMKTLGITYDKEHEYRFFIGIDRGDPLYDNVEVQRYLEKFAAIIKNVSIEFIYMDGIPRGHLTIMWNRLFQKAYEDGFDYFFQCGDDISFETTGWVNVCIETLQKSDNIGMTGPLNNNTRILTQSFVSRKHMEIFGVYFPEEIVNWCCDDWINFVYQNVGKMYPLTTYSCLNIGGEPRYDINNDAGFRHRFQKSLNNLRSFTSKLAKKDAKKIELYLSKKTL
jgi:hypothetical protein